MRHYLVLNASMYQWMSERSPIMAQWLTSQRHEMYCLWSWCHGFEPQSGWTWGAWCFCLNHTWTKKNMKKWMKIFITLGDRLWFTQLRHSNPTEFSTKCNKTPLKMVNILTLPKHVFIYFNIQQIKQNQPNIMP